MLRSTALVFFSSFVLLLLLLVPTHQSLLPLSDPFPDPFRILEHVPLELERDESVSFFAPARVDWKETHDGHVIRMDVPGLKREEVKVEVEEENRVLRVTGERKREDEEKVGDHWHRTERSYGKFWRQFKLPGDVDLDSVEAKLEDGVLTLNFSKLSPDKVKGPRVVDIAGGKEPAKKLDNKKEEL